MNNSKSIVKIEGQLVGYYELSTTSINIIKIINKINEKS
jgi:hypothetical protein